LLSAETLSGVFKHRRDHHRTCQREGKREAYENPFHRQARDSGSLDALD
jgi:hypothetical protein